MLSAEISIEMLEKIKTWSCGVSKWPALWSENSKPGKIDKVEIVTVAYGKLYEVIEKYKE